MTAEAGFETRSYLDFAGLARLRGEAASSGGNAAALKESARQFEAHFIQMALKSMRDATMRSELSGSAAEDTYTEMFDREVSMLLARRDALGVASMLERQLQQQAPSTRAVLDARAAGALPLHPPGPALPLDAGAKPLPIDAGRAAGHPLPLRAVPPELPAATPVHVQGDAK